MALSSVQQYTLPHPACEMARVVCGAAALLAAPRCARNSRTAADLSFWYFWHDGKGLAARGASVFGVGGTLATNLPCACADLHTLLSRQVRRHGFVD